MNRLQALKSSPQKVVYRRPTFWKRLLWEFKHNHALYVLVLLPLVILILFRYVPMYGVQIAFRNYKAVHGVNGSEWVGLKYFVKFFTSINCWPLIRNTLSINLYSLATFPLALILALLLNYIPSHRYRKTVQLVSYAPHFISTVVMCGMLLQFLDVRTGMINEVLKILLPTFCILLIMRTGSILNIGYEKILLLQNNLNKPISDVIATYTYQIGLNSSGIPQYSYGAAIGLFSNIINMAILLLVNNITKRLSGNGLF